jgi:predicted Rossmann-fold nucleotide-binding protein
MNQRSPIIGVIGSGQCESNIYQLAEEVGQKIARKGAVLVCGGLGGVMEAAAKGASSAGGLTVGILPGPSTARPATSSSPTQQTLWWPWPAAPAPSPRSVTP